MSDSTNTQLNKEIIRLLISKKKLIILGTFITLIGVSLNLLFPWAIKIIIDVAIPTREPTILIITICAIVILPILSTMLMSATNLFHIEVGGHVTDFLRKEVLTKISKLSPSTVGNLKIGRLTGCITRLCGEVGEVYIRQELLPAISSLFMSIGIIGFIMYLSWKLTLVALCIIPLILYLSRVLARKSESKTTKLIRLLNEGDAYFTELVTGMKTVQAFGQEEREYAYIDKWIKEHRTLRNQVSIIRVWLMETLNKFEQSLGIGLVFAFGAWQATQNQISIGSLMAFTVYIPQLFMNVENIQKAYIGTKNVKPVLSEIHDILNHRDEIIDIPNAISPKKMEGSISFRNVSFQYKDDRTILKNISFHIKAGENIAIVGSTGSGKTTILDLIMRFYHPCEGEILLDGKDIREYSWEFLKRNIGIVSQDIFLWNRSIKENLEYIPTEVTEEQIIQATKIAQIHDFIEQLPEGYNTIVGDRGIRLSGGEKQRLAIARSILYSPKILLLDEPTSALDAKTESLLQEQLEKMFNNKTVITVAHRLATIRNADRIVVVQDGHIVEVGTHYELINNCDIYYELYEKQFQVNKREILNG